MNKFRFNFLNNKTKKECGLDYVLLNLNLNTPFGKELASNMMPFMPGEEEDLITELLRVKRVIELIETNPVLNDKLNEIFMTIKDVRETIKRSKESPLSVVELFDVKQLLLRMREILILTKDYACDNKAEVGGIPKEYILKDTESLLDELDPSKDRIESFYIYDDFSPILGELRTSKKETEVLIRREQKNGRDELKKKYNLNLTPKFDIVLAKSHPDFDKISKLDELLVESEDYKSVTFVLKPSNNVHKLTEEIEAINEKIEIEEERVCEILTAKIAENYKTLSDNCKTIGLLDFTLAKANLSVKYNLKCPEIINDFSLSFVDGRNIEVEENLRKRGVNYTPVSVELKEGVTVITGANMGGKTVSLKLCAQIPVMAQYGFFVPAKNAKIGLSNFVRMLIGDSQSLERGLSSFGSEMEQLKEIFNQCNERSLLFVDEIASGTNPTEGCALTKSVIDYLSKRPYISLITTHFETGKEKERVINLQVRGLRDCDFDKLYRRIESENRSERIKTISKFMDYSLMRIKDESEVPKDALNIAAILGIDSEIIDGAKEYLS